MPITFLATIRIFPSFGLILLINSLVAVASLSLVVQNGMIGACSVVIFLMFYYDLNVCLHTGLFLGLVVIVMVLTAGAYLANVANKISIEKDWAVVIADNNKDNLAGKGSSQSACVAFFF